MHSRGGETGDDGGFSRPGGAWAYWEHILDRPSEGGSVAKQSGIKTVFVGLTEDQIKARVRAAWRVRERLRSQSGLSGVERVLYQGTDPRSRQVAQFWYNVGTRIVETAYPVGVEQ